MEVGAVQAYVENGLAGCALAVERRAIAVVVDALRASACVASLFHYGTARLLVVRDVAEAFAQRAVWPNAILVGERGGPMVPGFDRGNSPLQEPPQTTIEQVIFSSSNCSRCCVGVGNTPAAFLGTTVNATATARAVLQVAQSRGLDEVVLVTAGAAEDEVRLTIEDHLAAGAILAACTRLGGAVTCANDRARVAGMLYGHGVPQELTREFLRSDNGRRLAGLGLGRDVEFAARLDVLTAVPRLAGLVSLDDGGHGAMLVAF